MTTVITSVLSLLMSPSNIDSGVKGNGNVKTVQSKH